jgi:hypothetical protein
LSQKWHILAEFWKIKKTGNILGFSRIFCYLMHNNEEKLPFFRAGIVFREFTYNIWPRTPNFATKMAQNPKFLQDGTAEYFETKKNTSV